jgi:dihydrofolate reductase
MKNTTPLSIIVAISKDGYIGINNDLPWGKLPADLNFFKKITSGHPIIMGRNTFESIGRPLPNRTNIIISSDKNYKVEGCIVFNNINDAMEYANLENPSEIFFIGGGKIYSQVLDIVDIIYLTIIDFSIEDNFSDISNTVKFPEINKNNFLIKHLEKININASNKYSCDFYKYIKK